MYWVLGSLSAVLLGVMVARAAKPPLAVAAVLVGFFAIFHGPAHGTGLPAGQSGLAYSIGFVTATGCLHGIGIAIGEVNRWPAGRVLLRAAGIAVEFGLEADAASELNAPFLHWAGGATPCEGRS